MNDQIIPGATYVVFVPWIATSSTPQMFDAMASALESFGAEIRTVVGVEGLTQVQIVELLSDAEPDLPTAMVATATDDARDRYLAGRPRRPLYATRDEE